MKEVEEVDAKYPGTMKILKFNRSEWFLLLMGSVGCILTGAIMPVFALFYSEMFAVIFSNIKFLLLTPYNVVLKTNQAFILSDIFKNWRGFIEQIIFLVSDVFSSSCCKLHRILDESKLIDIFIT